LTVTDRFAILKSLALLTLTKGEKMSVTKPKNWTKTSYSAQVETVTPAMAQEWLNVNTNNRPKNKNTVLHSQTMIENGQWQINGESIKISDAGTLLDGQHRLQAIVNSGVPVEMFVVRGLSTEAFQTIDAGKARSYGDFLKINGTTSTNPAALAAAARVAMSFNKDTGEYVYSGSKTSVPSLIQFTDNHIGLVNCVQTQITALYGKKLCSVSVAAGLNYIFSLVDPEAADTFFSSLATGANLEDGSPVLALRNRLISLSGGGHAGATHQKMIISYFVQAFNAYRAGRKIQSVSYSPERLIVLNDFAGSML